MKNFRFLNVTDCFSIFVYLIEKHTKVYNDIIVYDTGRLHSVHNLKLYYVAHCSNLKLNV